MSFFPPFDGPIDVVCDPGSESTQGGVQNRGDPSVSDYFSPHLSSVVALHPGRLQSFFEDDTENHGGRCAKMLRMVNLLIKDSGGDMAFIYDGIFNATLAPEEDEDEDEEAHTVHAVLSSFVEALVHEGIIRLHPINVPNPGYNFTTFNKAKAAVGFMGNAQAQALRPLFGFTTCNTETATASNAVVFNHPKPRQTLCTLSLPILFKVIEAPKWKTGYKGKGSDPDRDSWSVFRRHTHETTGGKKKGKRLSEEEAFQDICIPIPFLWFASVLYALEYTLLEWRQVNMREGDEVNVREQALQFLQQQANVVLVLPNNDDSMQWWLKIMVQLLSFNSVLPFAENICAALSLEDELRRGLVVALNVGGFDMKIAAINYALQASGMHFPGFSSKYAGGTVIDARMAKKFASVQETSVQAQEANAQTVAHTASVKFLVGTGASSQGDVIEANAVDIVKEFVAIMGDKNGEIFQRLVNEGVALFEKGVTMVAITDQELDTDMGNMVFDELTTIAETRHGTTMALRMARFQKDRIAQVCYMAKLQVDLIGVMIIMLAKQLSLVQPELQTQWATVSLTGEFVHNTHYFTFMEAVMGECVKRVAAANTQVRVSKGSREATIQGAFSLAKEYDQVIKLNCTRGPRVFGVEMVNNAISDAFDVSETCECFFEVPESDDDIQLDITVPLGNKVSTTLAVYAPTVPHETTYLGFTGDGNTYSAADGKNDQFELVGIRTTNGEGEYTDTIINRIEYSQTFDYQGAFDSSLMRTYYNKTNETVHPVQHGVFTTNGGKAVKTSCMRLNVHDDGETCVAQLYAKVEGSDAFVLAGTSSFPSAALMTAYISDDDVEHVASCSATNDALQFAHKFNFVDYMSICGWKERCLSMVQAMQHYEAFGEPATQAEDEEEATQVVEDEEEATQVVEDEEEATQVVEDEEEATQVVEDEEEATQVVEDTQPVEEEATQVVEDTQPAEEEATQVVEDTQPAEEEDSDQDEEESHSNLALAFDDEDEEEPTRDAKRKQRSATTEEEPTPALKKRIVQQTSSSSSSSSTTTIVTSSHTALASVAAAAPVYSQYTIQQSTSKQFFIDCILGLDGFEPVKEKLRRDIQSPGRPIVVSSRLQSGNQILRFNAMKVKTGKVIIIGVLDQTLVHGLPRVIAGFLQGGCRMAYELDVPTSGPMSQIRYKKIGLLR